MVTSQFENAYMVHTLAELHHTASKSGRGSVYMSFCYNPVSSECLHCMWDSVLHLTQSNDKNHTPGMLDVDVLCHTVSPLQPCSPGPDSPMSREAPSCQNGISLQGDTPCQARWQSTQKQNRQRGHCTMLESSFTVTHLQLKLYFVFIEDMPTNLWYI